MTDRIQEHIIPVDDCHTVDWKHESRIRDLFRKMAPTISDYTFANLYLYRHRHRHRIIEAQGIDFFTGVSPEGRRYVMPGTDLREIPMPLILRFLQAFDCFYPVPEESLAPFRKDFLISCDEAETDYRYLIEKLAALKGSELKRKRHKIQQFQTLYGHGVEPLGRGNRSRAHEILTQWQERQGLSPEMTDYALCLEALEKMEDLALQGFLHYGGQKPAGFILGEPLNRDTFLVSFAKGNGEFKGIYETMFNHMARFHEKGFRYLNFAEDLGKETLRRAKASYRPEGMIRKYRVSLGKASPY